MNSQFRRDPASPLHPRERYPRPLRTKCTDPLAQLSADSNWQRLTSVPDVESSDAGSTGMTMREFDGRAAYDGTATATSCRASSPGTSTRSFET